MDIFEMFAWLMVGIFLGYIFYNLVLRRGK